MIAINLLPWREQKLTYQKKLLQVFLLIIAIIIISAFFIGHWLIKNASLHLTKQIMQLELKLNRAEQLKTIHLDAEQKNVIHHGLMNTFIVKQILLSSHSTQTVCFTEIVYAGGFIQFSGLANSAMNLTEFLLNWKTIEWFKQIQIESIQQTNNGLVRFKFHGELKE